MMVVCVCVCVYEEDDGTINLFTFSVRIIFSVL